MLEELQLPIELRVAFVAPSQGTEQSDFDCVRLEARTV